MILKTLDLYAICLFCCIAMLASSPIDVLAAKPALREIDIQVVDTGIEIQTEIKHVFNDELIEAITTGIPVEFSYTVQLMKKRWFWFNKEVDLMTVTYSLVYDTLNKQYKFSCVNGSSAKTRITESIDECKTWIRTLRAVLPFSGNMVYDKGDYYIKVSAEAKCSVPGSFRTKGKSSKEFTLDRESGK